MLEVVNIFLDLRPSGDPKPLVTSHSPEKVSIEIDKGGVWFLGMLPFWKTQHHFPFPCFLYFRASNLGKIDANFTWEIVTSFEVLDHRAASAFLRDPLC